MATEAVTRSRTVRHVFRQATPIAADTDLITDYTHSGGAQLLRVTVCLSATSVVNVIMGDASNDITMTLNEGVACTANYLYAFDVPAITSYVYNVQCATLQVDPIPLIAIHAVKT